VEILTWPVVKFVPYSRNPRKNDHAIERMAASIREFGFKTPILASSDGSVVDVIVGHWQKLTGQQGTLEGDGRSFTDIAAEHCPAGAEAEPDATSKT
jgi:hypothetical protein